MRRIVWLLIMLVLVAAPSRGTASVLCKKKNGAVVAREACKKGETPLDLSKFGAVGSQGPAGPPGPAGSGSAPVVRDATGTRVGVLNGGSALREIGGQLFSLEFSR